MIYATSKTPKKVTQTTSMSVSGSRKNFFLQFLVQECDPENDVKDQFPYKNLIYETAIMV